MLNILPLLIVVTVPSALIQSSNLQTYTLYKIPLVDDVVTLTFQKLQLTRSATCEQKFYLSFSIIEYLITTNQIQVNVEHTTIIHWFLIIKDVSYDLFQKPYFCHANLVPMN